MRAACALLLVLLQQHPPPVSDWRIRRRAPGSAAPCCATGSRSCPALETGVQFDRPPTSLAPDSLFLIADVHAAKDNAHGFTGFIPYLSISFTLTKDGEPTFKKIGPALSHRRQERPALYGRRRRWAGRAPIT